MCNKNAHRQKNPSSQTSLKHTAHFLSYERYLKSNTWKGSSWIGHQKKRFPAIGCSLVQGLEEEPNQLTWGWFLRWTLCHFWTSLVQKKFSESEFQKHKKICWHVLLLSVSITWSEVSEIYQFVTVFVYFLVLFPTATTKL
jgi:hypothetical protein